MRRIPGIGVGLGILFAALPVHATVTTYIYDTCTYGKGRLCSVAQSAQDDIMYSYDLRGNVTQTTQRIANTGMTGNVDIAPDGTRFAVLMPAEAAESRETRGHFILVPNFFDELRRRLAASAK